MALTVTSRKAHRHGFCNAGSHVDFPSLEGPVRDGGGGGGRGVMGSEGRVGALRPPVKFFRISCLMRI